MVQSLYWKVSRNGSVWGSEHLRPRSVSPNQRPISHRKYQIKHVDSIDNKLALSQWRGGVYGYRMKPVEENGPWLWRKILQHGDKHWVPTGNNVPWWTFQKKGMAARKEPKHEEGEPFTEEENVRNPLSSYFKVEAKIDILPFDRAIDAERLDDWLRQIEVYFTCRGLQTIRKSIFLTTDKWSRLALVRKILWAPTKARQRSVVDWEDFKTVLSKMFYPVYWRQLQVNWQHLWRKLGQEVNEDTVEFHK